MAQPIKAPLHWIDPQNQQQTQWATQYLEKKGLLPCYDASSIEELISLIELPIQVQLIAKNMRAAWYATDRRKRPNKVKVCNWEISTEFYKQLKYLSNNTPMNKTIEKLIGQAYKNRLTDSDWLKEEKKKLVAKENLLKKKQRELDLREESIGSTLDADTQKARDFAEQAMIQLAQKLWAATHENIAASLTTDTPPSPEDKEMIDDLYKEQQSDIVKPLELLAMNSKFLQKTLKHKDFKKRLAD